MKVQQIKHITGTTEYSIIYNNSTNIGVVLTHRDSIGFKVAEVVKIAFERKMKLDGTKPDDKATEEMARARDAKQYPEEYVHLIEI